MSIYQIIGIGILSTLLLSLIKDSKLFFPVSALCSLFLLFPLLSRIGKSVSFLSELSEKYSLSGELGYMLKCSALALCAGITASFCRDMGEGSLGEKIELCAKAELLVISLPLITSIIEAMK